MPNTAKLPPMSEIKKKLDKGWTHQEIADWAGVSRSTVSVALHRLGDTAPIRYEREIPWKVKDEHIRKYHVCMLRLQARLDRGQELTEGDLRRVTAWRNALERDDAVIHYEPDTEAGWWKVKRRKGIDRWWIREPAASKSKGKKK